jgi:hypothetical protein
MPNATEKEASQRYDEIKSEWTKKGYTAVFIIIDIGTELLGYTDYILEADLVYFVNGWEESSHLSAIHFMCKKHKLPIGYGRL